MKITVTIELGHVVEDTPDGRVVDVKDTNDEHIAEGDSFEDAAQIVADHLGDALTEAGFEPATYVVDWDS